MFMFVCWDFVHLRTTITGDIFGVTTDHITKRVGNFVFNVEILFLSFYRNFTEFYGFFFVNMQLLLHVCRSGDDDADQ